MDSEISSFLSSLRTAIKFRYPIQSDEIIIRTNHRDNPRVVLVLHANGLVQCKAGHAGKSGNSPTYTPFPVLGVVSCTVVALFVFLLLSPGSD